MNYRNLHIISLLLLGGTLFGQKSINLSPNLVVAGSSYRLKVTINSKDNIFKFKNNSIVAASPNISNKKELILKLTFEVTGNNLQETLNGKITLNKGIVTHGNNDNKLSFESTGLQGRIDRIFSIENFTSNTSIDISLINSNQPFEIKIAQKTTIPNDCSSISSQKQKLNCLLKLTQPSASQTIEIQSLKNQKADATRALKSFNAHHLDEPNTFHIKCSNCNRIAFTISYSSKVASNNSSWRTRTITKNTTATISHKVWGLKRSISLKYRDNEEKENKEEEEIAPNSSQEDALTEVIDTQVIKPDTAATMEVVTQDTFWQDSIVPILNISNVFSLNPILLQRLEEYQSSPTASPTKKAIATVLPHLRQIAIGLSVFTLFLIFWRRRKSRKNTVSVEEIPINTSIETIPEKDKKTTLTPLDVPKTKTETTQEPVDKNPITDENEISFEEVSTDASAIAPPIEVVTSHPHYVLVDLLPCWRDTYVERLFIHRNCIRDFGLHLEKENIEDGVSKTVEELSEIGGFLLGYVYPQDDRYDLAIATFIPITPESNDRYAVKFGDQAWEQLDDAFRLYPGQRLIGWFHTHPGHGLFLSKADIDLHESAFQKPYQFAMEIDPVSPQCDVAFFTRQPNGVLNNIKNRRLTQWWSFWELKEKAKIR